MCTHTVRSLCDSRNGLIFDITNMFAFMSIICKTQFDIPQFYTHQFFVLFFFYSLHKILHFLFVREKHSSHKISYRHDEENFPFLKHPSIKKSTL